MGHRHPVFLSWGKTTLTLGGTSFTHIRAQYLSLSHTHTHAQGATRLDATLREDCNYDRGRLLHVKHTHTHKHTHVTGGQSLGRTSEGRLQLRPGAAVAP